MWQSCNGCRSEAIVSHVQWRENDDWLCRWGSMGIHKRNNRYPGRDYEDGDDAMELFHPSSNHHQTCREYQRSWWSRQVPVQRSAIGVWTILLVYHDWQLDRDVCIYVPILYCNLLCTVYIVCPHDCLSKRERIELFGMFTFHKGRQNQTHLLFA